VKYICDRCDLRAESSLGHHVCKTPKTIEIVAAVGIRVTACSGCEGCDGCLLPADRNGICVNHWLFDLGEVVSTLAPLARSRGYRWSLSSVGDGTEYRATFEHGLGNTIASVLDTTPARAFARGFLRLPKESEG
jgi:hypothetical protein